MRKLWLLALGLLIAVLGLVPTSSRASPSGGSRPDPSIVGRWGDPIELGVIGIHAAVLHNGKVLLYQYPVDDPGPEAHVYDPVTGDNVDVSWDIERNFFCGGLSILPDGRVLITGGQAPHTPADGIAETEIFDPDTNTFSEAGSMAFRRWYPTNTQLPDGRTFVTSGQDSPGLIIRRPEIYDPAAGTWSKLPRSANHLASVYPRMFVMPDGRLFQAPGDQDTYYFDPSTNTWTFVDDSNFGFRRGGAVLLPGLHKVLVSGGNSGIDATDTAEIIDLSQPSPEWEYTTPMNRPRLNGNLLLLPDGTVIAVGGDAKLGFQGPQKKPEIFDPVTETWTLMAAQQAQRSNHSTAVLLPDGRVLSAGTDQGGPYESAIEIFSPPYLFRGPRPTISSAPASATYGEQFTVGSPNAANISRIALIRPSAVTHSNNMDQRYVDLTFGPGPDPNSLSVNAPTTANEAPPGYYMLFVLNSRGVPSVATFIHIA